jgi:hypothetical protein
MTTLEQAEVGAFSKDHEFECRIDRYTYQVSSFFRTEATVSASDHMKAIIQDNAIRSFAKSRT